MKGTSTYDECKKNNIERRYLISGKTISRHALSQKIGKPK
jgi:hypothetical protein